MVLLFCGSFYIKWGDFLLSKKTTINPLTPLEFIWFLLFGDMAVNSQNGWPTQQSMLMGLRNYVVGKPSQPQCSASHYLNFRPFLRASHGGMDFPLMHVSSSYGGRLLAYQGHN